MLNVSVYNSKLLFSILAFAEWYRLKEKPCIFEKTDFMYSRVIEVKVCDLSKMWFYFHIFHTVPSDCLVGRCFACVCPFRSQAEE